MNSDAPEAVDPRLLEELFFAAGEITGERRAAFLDERCAGQPELRRAVENLLRVRTEAEAATFWESPALHWEARHMAADNGAPAFERLGPYRILSRIGTGGMGTVYLAERDDEGLSKRVAIKMVRPLIDSDFDLVRRFQQERRILATLEHPNIARMLDAGRTPDGLPYLVMEYVEGIPIDRYAAERSLGVAERLALFRTICAAVSYAHANLIVHRDLKPRNILVTADGVPKLLDFGIAKMLSETPDADATSTGLMTTGYASPEQVAGQPITTASDVYSLGMILREQLTGAKPAAAADSVRPSSMLILSRARQQAVSPSVPPDARRKVGSDLDNVVLMALRKEPARRYASVADLSEDVRRVLEGYPVKARPDTFSYRARRFVRRRRLEVGIALATMLALAAAGAITLAQYRASNRRFDDTRNLVNSFLFEVNDAITDLPGSTSARLLLAKRAQQYLDILARDRSSDPVLRRDLGTAYRKLGDILGQPYHANLGDTAGALSNYRKASEVLEAIRAAGHEDPAVLTELGTAYALQSEILGRERKPDEAIRLSEQSLRLLERAAGSAPGSREARLRVANAYLDSSNAYLVACWERHSVALCRSAIAAAEKTQSIALQLVAEAPDNDPYRRAASNAFHYIGFAEGHISYFTSDPGYAIRSLHHHQEGHAQLEAAYRLNPGRYRRLLADSWGDLCQSYLQTRDPDHAASAAREDLRIMQEIADGDPKNIEASRDLAVAYQRSAAVLVAQHSFRAAAAETERALMIYERLLRLDPGNQSDRENIVQGRDGLAGYLLSAGDRAAALALIRRNLELEAGLPEPLATIRTALDYGLMGDALVRTDKSQAAACYEKAAALWERLRDSGRLPAIYAERPAALRLALAKTKSR